MVLQYPDDILEAIDNIEEDMIGFKIQTILPYIR
jgi:hypothetical protein